MSSRTPLACAIAALAFGLLVPGSSPARAGSLTPELARRMDRVPASGMISVIVHLRDQAPVAAMRRAFSLRSAGRAERHRETIRALRRASASQQPLLAHLQEAERSGSVGGYTGYWISNLVVVKATVDEVTRIAARADVDVVEPNFHPVLVMPVEVPRGPAPAGRRMGIGVSPGVRAIRAPEVWYGLGINGEGTLVANLDTGVDGHHPALETRWRGYQGRHPADECWLDLATGFANTPEDDGSIPHGTHVMGTLTGLGAATQDTVGVAWGAEWIACNAIAAPNGSDADNMIIRAFQWFADPDGNPETTDDVPDVIQNSWGVSQEEPGYHACDSYWWAAIDNCEAAGTVVTWSAGNSGPGAQTIIVPADRATTPTNAFSVGAVDAHAAWPYPIAFFSSRGPTTCEVPDSNKIKPEVVAPGVDVYSSVAGGGYQGGWSGTSMAGPHAAGIVALIRQANPDLDVDTIKEILLKTARDEGADGEDNTYGWGFVDAYAAVQMAMAGFGEIAGTVRNGSWRDEPLPGARIDVLGTRFHYFPDATGAYHGAAPASSYRVVASLLGFRPDTAAVTVQGGQHVQQDFALMDDTGPTITAPEFPSASTDTLGPYPVQTRVVDPSTVSDVQLIYRRDGGDWIAQSMRPGTKQPADSTQPDSAGLYAGSLPGASLGSRYDYYIRATDGPGIVSLSPSPPDTSYTFEIRRSVYRTAFELPDSSWQVGSPDDAATSGIWVRARPNATYDNGKIMQPGSDHGGGGYCYVTGNDSTGTPGGTNDVDNGCTTLRSPVFNVAGEERAYVSYWRWFGEGGAAADDTFRVDVSSDGGASWVALERVAQPDTVWHRAQLRLNDFISLTDRVCLRFRACDLGARGIVEAALDDVSVEAFTARRVPPPIPPPPQRTRLVATVPNPSRPSAAIRFELAASSPVRLRIYSPAGSLIRSLDPGTLAAGPHEIPWDGRDDRGRLVSSGVYYCRLEAGGVKQSRSLVVLR